MTSWRRCSPRARKRRYQTALQDTIIARSEGNPFYAEELLDAAGDDGAALPRGLRDVLLQRVARLDRQTQGVLRLAAAAGRDVGYPLLHGVADLPERDVRESLRVAVEHGVLVPEQATGSFRFRHALLAEAIYATILPGEREELHARLAGELARAGAPAAELAPHWAAAGRPAEAFAASVEAARETEAVFGLAEALAHVERALALWDSVPDATGLAGLELAELCSWAAQLASTTGAAPRAVELARRAVALVGENDPLRASHAHERLGTYLAASGDSEAGLTATRRAVELLPSHPPSPERAQVLASLGNRLMLAWRHDESRVISEQALALAREVGARPAEFVALAMLGIDLAYLGRGEEGLVHLRSAVRLAEDNGDPTDLRRAYVWLTDVLTMLGRARESARVAADALDVLERFGIDVTGLVTNQIEALVATGEWDEAETDQRRRRPRRHDELATPAARPPRRARSRPRRLRRRAGAPRSGQAANGGSARARWRVVRRRRDGARPVGAPLDGRRQGRAQRPVAGARPRCRPDPRTALRTGTARTGRARSACARPAGLRRARPLARTSAKAARGRSRAPPRRLPTSRQTPRRGSLWPRPSTSARAARLNRRHGRRLRRRGRSSGVRHWRPTATGARLKRSSQPARRVSTRAFRCRQRTASPRGFGRSPCYESSSYSQSVLGSTWFRPRRSRPARSKSIQELLGLTPREAEVLSLVARGYTNREIAAALVISVKTAGVHVSHILRKLDAPNRREAAAIAHRVAPPGRNDA